MRMLLHAASANVRGQDAVAVGGVLGGGVCGPTKARHVASWLVACMLLLLLHVLWVLLHVLLLHVLWVLLLLHALILVPSHHLQRWWHSLLNHIIVKVL